MTAKTLDTTAEAQKAPTVTAEAMITVTDGVNPKESGNANPSESGHENENGHENESEYERANDTPNGSAGNTLSGSARVTLDVSGDIEIRGGDPAAALHRPEGKSVVDHAHNSQNLSPPRTRQNRTSNRLGCLQQQQRRSSIRMAQRRC